MVVKVWAQKHYPLLPRCSDMASLLTTGLRRKAARAYAATLTEDGQTWVYFLPHP